MTETDKLSALVERAIENGWVPDRYDETERRSSELNYEFVAIWYDFRSYPENYKLFIFDHDFARALFGDKKIEVYGGAWTKGMSKPTTIELHQVPAYLHHLQQAVISTDPIEYMYKEVFGE